METTKKWLGLAAISLCGLLVAGCGDDADNDDKGGGGELAYVAVGRFPTGEVSTGYISYIEEFGKDVTLDLRDNGLELQGEPLAVAFGDDSYLYVGTNTSGVITRYEATPTGFTPAGSVNLAAAGVDRINGYQAALQLINKEKAYFLHEGSRQLVIWNPTELKVEGSRKFTELEEQAGITMQFAGFPLRVGKHLVYGIGWRASDQGVTYIVEGAGALVIDTETDEVTIIRDKDRCGYTLSVAEGADGYIYLASESLTAAAVYLDTENLGAAAPPCLLRFDLESMAIDPEYYFELADLYEEEHTYAGTIYPAKEKGKAYMMVLDESILPPPPGESGYNTRTLTTQHAWLTYELTLGDAPTAKRIESLPPTSAGALLVQAADELYLPEFDNADPATPRTLLRSYEGFERGDVILEILGHTRSIAKVIR